LTVGAAQDGHVAAVDVYSDVLVEALSTIIVLHSGNNVASVERTYTVLNGLIVEVDPLLAAGLNEPSFFDKAWKLVEYVSVSADADSRPSLRACAWRSALTAANWPIDDCPRKQPDPSSLADLPALPPELIDLAQRSLQDGSSNSDLTFTATLTVTLWANAVAASKRGDRTAVDELRTVALGCRKELNESFQLVLGETLEQSMNPRLADHRQILSLYDAVLAWAQDLTGGKSPLWAHVSISGGRTIEVRSPNRRYHGLRSRGRDPLVVVEEHDGSLRFLPEMESERGRGFQWGYSGGGPVALAKALVNDALNDSMRCPDCFGAASLTAWTILCERCHNTGCAFDLESLAHRLVSDMIAGLPSSRHWRSRVDTVEWTITQQDVLDSALAHVNVTS
jgi:hypothetical protein